MSLRVSSRHSLRVSSRHSLRVSSRQRGLLPPPPMETSHAMAEAIPAAFHGQAIPRCTTLLSLLCSCLAASAATKCSTSSFLKGIVLLSLLGEDTFLAVSATNCWTQGRGTTTSVPKCRPVRGIAGSLPWPVRTYTYIHAYIHTHIHAYTHTHTYIHT